MQCEQQPPQLLPAIPKGEFCAGTEAERRTCFQRERAQWDLTVMSLYQGEVSLRAAEDQCLANLRKNGVIK